MKRLTQLFALLLIASLHSASTGAQNVALQEGGNSIPANEAQAQLIMRQLISAEATFIVTSGNRYGSLVELAELKLIGDEIADGVHSGYSFTATTKIVDGTAIYRVLARPLEWGVTGVRSFQINQHGVLRETHLQNPRAAQMQPSVAHCGSVGCVEYTAQANMRSLTSAQATFQSSVGEGRYGTLQELGAKRLIDSALASGVSEGYAFDLRVAQDALTGQSSFEVVATPQPYYGMTGSVSYYVDQTGVLRFKRAGAAGKDDKPICEN
jgi:hypothetical protein